MGITKMGCSQRSVPRPRDVQHPIMHSTVSHNENSVSTKCQSSRNNGGINDAGQMGTPPCDVPPERPLWRSVRSPLASGRRRKRACCPQLLRISERPAATTASETLAGTKQKYHVGFSMRTWPGAGGDELCSFPCIHSHMHENFPFKENQPTPESKRVTETHAVNVPTGWLRGLDAAEAGL